MDDHEVLASAHAARRPISARRNRQARLKVNVFAAISVAAEDDDEAAPVAEVWLMCEMFPMWLQPFEGRLLDASRQLRWLKRRR